MGNESATTRNDMSKVNLFLDSSILFAGIASATGAARVLLLLAETDHIHVTVSEHGVDVPILLAAMRAKWTAWSH